MIDITFANNFHEVNPVRRELVLFGFLKLGVLKLVTIWFYGEVIVYIVKTKNCFIEAENVAYIRRIAEDLFQPLASIYFLCLQHGAAFIALSGSHL